MKLAGAHAWAHLPYTLSQTLVHWQLSLPQAREMEKRSGLGQKAPQVLALSEQRLSGVTNPKDSKS